MKSTVAFVLLATSVAAVYGERVSHAEPLRVVVLKFKGPGGESARRMIIDLISKQHEIVPVERFEAAGQKLDVVTFGPRTIVAVARRARVDAVVEGEISGGSLALSVRESRKGRVIDTIEVRVSGGPLSGEERDTLRDDLMDLFASVTRLDEPGEIEFTRPQRYDTRAKPLLVAPGTGETDGTDGPVLVNPQLGVDAPLRAKKAPMFALSGGVGLSASRRQLSFVFDPTLVAAAQPQGLDGSPGAGVALSGDATLIPIGLTATFGYERSFGARLGYPDGGKVKEVGVAQRQLAAGLRMGRTVKKRFKLHVCAGYREIAYTIANRPNGLLIPDTRYSFAELGGGGRVPFRDDKMAVTAEAAYLHALSTSGITDETAYGKATVTGWRGNVAIELRTNATTTVRAGINYAHVVLAFDGSGRLTHGLDDDPTDTDVQSASDGYMGGYVLVSFTL